MVEKIIINPQKIRGLGNIVSKKTEDDFTLSGCNIDEGTDTVNGVSSTVFSLESNSVHDYSIAFGSSTYNAIAGSCTVTVTLLDDGVAVSGATISVTGSDSSLYTGITNSNGVATINIVGLTANVTLTASFSNVSDTASVTVLSYIFYDGCASDNTSQYSNTARIGSTTNVATLTFDGTANAYYTTTTTSYDSWFGWVIPNSRGLNNIKITCKVKLAGTSAYNQFLIGCADNLAQSSSNNGNYDLYRIRGDNKADYLHNSGNEVTGSSKSTTVQNTYVDIVFQKSGTTITGSVYNSSNTLLSTYTYSNVNSYTNPYFLMMINTNRTADHAYIKEIKVESL